MAKKYLDQLTEFMRRTGLFKNEKIECKHFFAGAACYVNGYIYSSLTPVGLALKLPEENRDELKSRGAKLLKYFPNAPIKKDYIVLTQSMIDDKDFESLIKLSINYAQNKH